MIKIFLSSTFLEMAQEREEIAKQVVPWTRELGRKYKEHVEICDLRWGIDTDNIIKTIELCLKKIDLETDSVVAIIGNEAGTQVEMTEELKNLLKESGLNYLARSASVSITQLELEYGILSRHNAVGRCYYKKGAENGKNSGLLGRLKEKLGEKHCVVFSDAEEMVSDLKEYVETLVKQKKKPHTPKNWIEEELSASASLVEDILREAADRVGGRTELRLRLLNDIKADNNRIVCLYGKSGFGKSTIMADTYREMGAEGENNHFVACGYGERSKTYIHLLQQLLYLVSRCSAASFAEDVWDVRTVGAAERELERLIIAYNDNEEADTMRVFIDGLDKLKLSEIQENTLCRILAQAKRMTTVISCIDDIDYHEPDVKKHQVKELTEQDIKQILCATMVHAETNFDGLVEAVKKKAGAVSPLYLIGVVTVLKMSVADAQQSSDDAVFAHYKKLIEEMPDTVEEMCRYVFRSVGTYLNWNGWERFLQLLSATSNGISKNDLAGLFAYHKWEWWDAPFAIYTNYLDHYFYYLPDGRIHFSHDIVRAAERSFYQSRLRKIQTEWLFPYLQATVSVDSLHIEDGLYISNNECCAEYALGLFAAVDAMARNEEADGDGWTALLMRHLQKLLGDHEWLVSHVAGTNPEALLPLLYRGVRMVFKEDFGRRGPAREVSEVFLQSHAALKKNSIGDPDEDSEDLRRYIEEKCDDATKETYALFLAEYIGACESFSVGERSFAFEALAMGILTADTTQSTPIDTLLRGINCVFYSNNKLLKKAVDKKVSQEYCRFLTKEAAKAVSDKAIQWFDEHETQVTDTLTKGRFINNIAQYHNALKQYDKCWPFRVKALNIKYDNLRGWCSEILADDPVEADLPADARASVHQQFWEKWFMWFWPHVNGSKEVHSELFDIAVSYRTIATDSYYFADMENVASVAALQNGADFLKLSIHIQGFIRDGRERDMVVTRIRLLGMLAKLYEKLLAEQKLTSTVSPCQRVEEELRNLADKTRRSFLRYLRHDRQEKNNYNKNLSACIANGLDLTEYLLR